ncbi:MAG: acyl-CoA carboxylase subunit epsilon [Microbacteriaceae bacterium]|nr:MAG: acyl-CoA carboxylase subunit epsilon [Microbacteriaceae bacterium]
MTRSPDELPAAIRVVGGDPTPEELAAATAVLQKALDELAGMHRRTQRSMTTWERESRGLRAPLERGGWNRWAR